MFELEDKDYYFLTDSSKSPTSIYCFTSLESLSEFNSNKCELKNDKSTAIPLFQCQIYSDINILLNTNKNYLILNKYLLNDDLCFDKKIEYCKIKNKRPLKTGFKINRVYDIDFLTNNNIKKIGMKYFRFHDYVEINCLDVLDFDNAKWVYKNNTENVITNGFTTNDQYTLVSNGHIIAEYKDLKDSESIGNLVVQNSNKGLDEQIVAMTFVLLTHQRYRDQSVSLNNGLLI